MPQYRRRHRRETPGSQAERAGQSAPCPGFDRKPALHEACARNGRQVIDELRTYLNNNVDRTDYPPIEPKTSRSAAVRQEGANYHVTGGRLKQQGMRWSELGAADTALLRTDLMNGKWRERMQEMRAA